VNLADPDPACDLRFLRDAGEPGDPEHLVSTSFGFGGINAALVFRRT
jgi:3-oxoacyl-[acyl-carrier-protein] synthase II